jgi:hypothetical protein
MFLKQEESFPLCFYLSLSALNTHAGRQGEHQRITLTPPPPRAPLRLSTQEQTKRFVQSLKFLSFRLRAAALLTEPRV